MGILSRVKNRLLGKRPAKAIGPGFPLAYKEERAELIEQVDNYGQKVGAAVVQSWEVGAAELGRALQGKPDEKMLIERFSDALVPALTPFQDLHKKTTVAMKLGFDRGSDAGQIAAANLAVASLVEGLGPSAREGWTKSVEYLRPLFETCADGEGARVAMLGHAPAMEAACVAAEAVLLAELAKAAGRATLWEAVTEPFDQWQLKLVRELEIAITHATRELVVNVRASA